MAAQIRFAVLALLASVATAAGPTDCVTCHPAEAKLHAQTAHNAAMVAPAGSMFAVHLPKKPLAEAANGYFFEYGQTQDGLTATVERGADRLTAPIVWIFGSGRQGQTPIVDYHGHFVEHRVSLYTTTGYGITIGQENGVSANAEHALGWLQTDPEAHRCFNCHATNVSSDLTSLTPGVQCIRCHAGADAHAQGHGSPINQPVNPGKLDHLAQVQLCGTCHRVKPPSGNDADIANVRFQPLRLMKSVCFAKSNIACTTCHPAHRNAQRDDADGYNRKCLDCHANQTTHVAEQKSSDCIACHMPKVSPAPGLTFTDHFISRGVRSKVTGSMVRLGIFAALSYSVALAGPQTPLDATTLADVLAHANELKAKGDAPGALAAYEQAAALDPKSAPLQDVIGFVLVILNRHPEATEHFEMAIALDPQFAPAHYHLGVLYWLDRNAGLCIPQLDSAVALDQKNLEYRLKLGEALNGTSHYDEAILQWTVAAALDPHSVRAWMGLGSAFQEKHDLKAAVDAFQHAVDADPANVEARTSLGTNLVNTRRADDGIAQFRKILELKPDDKMARVNIGFALIQKGELDEAIKELRAAIHANQGGQEADLAVAHYDLGVALKSKDDLDGAKAELRKAVELEPALAEGHYTLGILAWQLGDADEAAKEMRAALAIRSDYAEAWFILGSTLKQKGDLAGAEEAVRSSIRLNPGNPGAFNTLGQVLKAKGDSRGSSDAFAEGSRIKQVREAELGLMLKQHP